MNCDIQSNYLRVLDELGPAHLVSSCVQLREKCQICLGCLTESEHFRKILQNLLCGSLDSLTGIHNRNDQRLVWRVSGWNLFHFEGHLWPGRVGATPAAADLEWKPDNLIWICDGLTMAFCVCESNGANQSRTYTHTHAISPHIQWLLL